MTTFEDFYALLEIPQSAALDQIRQAFRAKMLKWHPDVNASAKATAFTQRLIVAYKILNDVEARARYDAEYSWHFPQPKADQRKQAPAWSNETSGTETDRAQTGYRDPDLDRWIRTARREAAEEWRQFATDFKGASLAALGGAARTLIGVLIFAIIGFILIHIL
ncbi:MAG: J domain-containing protein [Verrucomicrobiota bacterium]